MKIRPSKLNVRYLGFEIVADGRRLLFSVTSPGRIPTRATFDIPSGAFSGEDRISFQESAGVCYAKLRAFIGPEEEEVRDALHFRLSKEDIQEFRPRGRRPAARPKV